MTPCIPRRLDAQRNEQLESFCLVGAGGAREKNMNITPLGTRCTRRFMQASERASDASSTRLLLLLVANVGVD